MDVDPRTVEILEKIRDATGTEVYWSNVALWLGVASAFGLALVVTLGGGRGRSHRIAGFAVATIFVLAVFASQGDTLPTYAFILGLPAIFCALTVATFSGPLSVGGVLLAVGLSPVFAILSRAVLPVTEGIDPGRLANVPDRVASGELGHVSTSMLVWVGVISLIGMVVNMTVQRLVGPLPATADQGQPPKALPEERIRELREYYAAKPPEDLQAVLAAPADYHPDTVAVVRGLIDGRTVLRANGDGDR